MSVARNVSCNMGMDDLSVSLRFAAVRRPIQSRPDVEAMSSLIIPLDSLLDSWR